MPKVFINHNFRRLLLNQFGIYLWNISNLLLFTFFQVRKNRYDKISSKIKVLDGLDANSVTLEIPSTSSDSCKPYHRHLRNDKNNFVNVATSSNLYRTEIRCSTLSSRKKRWPRHYVHNIKRPYLDFEKMQKVYLVTIKRRKGLKIDQCGS